MQHLDEGTIHSWLDGALSREESRSVESHVAECASCASSVAEARGFIAASSRILTALDDAPGGVIPAERTSTRRNRVVWRAAAAVLVVALGGLAIRNTTSFTTDQKSQAVAEATTSTQAPTFNDAAEPSAPSGNVGAVAGAGAPAVAAPASGRGAVIVREKAERRVATGGVAQKAEADNPALFKAAATAPAAAPAAPRVASAAESKEVAADLTCTDCAETALRVVSVDSVGGERRTTYEIAPNQVVTLVESESTVRRISSATARAAERVVAQAAAANAKVADAKRADMSQAASVPTPAPPAALASQINTVRWTDSTSGKTLTLSGRLPVERLEAIRRQIQRERTAAAKKTP